MRRLFLILSMALGSIPAFANPIDDECPHLTYGRAPVTPTTFALEEAVAQLEGGHAAVALPSGLAAIVAALAAFAEAGAHILIADSVYQPTRNFCDKRLRGYGVEIEYYDPAIG
jgi:cystathionine beta-lyase